MSWDRFRRQYEAQGREKADGYAAEDFAGMSTIEQVQARTMLLDRALVGDAVDLSGLRYVGDAQTVATLAALQNATDQFGWRYDIVRLGVLFELTGDAGYLTKLMRYLDGSEQDARTAAANAIAWHALPPEAEPLLVARIEGGRHEGVILPLLQAWIGIKQRAVCDAACFQRYLSWTRRIKNARPGNRSAVLEQCAIELVSSRHL